MQRRKFIQTNASLGILMALGSQTDVVHAAQAAQPAPAGVGIEAQDIQQLQTSMQAGKLTSQGLCRFYLNRIRRIDQHGPTLRSVIELNPDALKIAAERDAERRQGKLRGPLHGIPVLIKDNIATADQMKTSAGSLAIAHFPADHDAHIITLLRAAGAVILGKTNLSEWANFRSSRSYSGWSARGGLTRNPHVLDRNSSGSSSGSAAACAANLAAFCVGTETDGSIVSPASVCGIVGMKPTVGLLSRAGIVPISASQDSAGPMTRTVRDAALALTAMAGLDPQDEATAHIPASAKVDFSKNLSPDGLRGARIGVVRSAFGSHPEMLRLMNQALETMRQAGATIIDPVELGSIDFNAELEVLYHEFKDGLNRYLPRYASREPVKNLADVIKWNQQHAKQELSAFGQEILIRSQQSAGLDQPTYQNARASCIKASRSEGIDLTLAKHQLDALVAPTGDPAWLTDMVNGDRSGMSFSSVPAVAGYPHISVPAGFINELPVALSFVGAAWSDAKLLQLAYAYEQASMQRRAPRFLATLKLK